MYPRAVRALRAIAYFTCPRGALVYVPYVVPHVPYVSCLHFVPSCLMCLTCTKYSMRKVLRVWGFFEFLITSPVVNKERKRFIL